MDWPAWSRMYWLDESPTRTSTVLLPSFWTTQAMHTWLVRAAAVVVAVTCRATGLSPVERAMGQTPGERAQRNFESFKGRRPSPWGGPGGAASGSVLLYSRTA